MGSTTPTTEGDVPRGRSASAAFSAIPVSMSGIRIWVDRQLRQWQVDVGTCDRVQLLVSELAANALRHTGSVLVEVRLSIGPGLEISIRDQDPVGLVRACYPGPEETAGRGLAIVEALSDAWGIHRDDAGKSVWCRFDPAVDPAAGTV